MLPWLLVAALAAPPARLVVEADRPAEVLPRLERAGARVEVAAGGWIQVRADPRAIARIPGVARVRSPWTAFEHDVVSEGLQTLFVRDWHALGLTGAGVRIAVIDTGYAGYDALLGTELPATVGLTDLRHDGTWASSAHGTAVAEILHDVAPDAELHLFAVFTGTEWLAAVDAVVQGEFDLVASSMGFGNHYPSDGTSPFSARATEVVRDHQIPWVNAAGNNGTRTWTGLLADDDGDGWLEMDGVEALPVHPSGTGEVFVDLRWDEPWAAATADLAIEVDEASSCPTRDAIASTPWERVICQVPGTAATVRVRLVSGDAVGRRAWIAAYHTLPAAYQTGERSIFPPGDAVGVITVGAVGWDDRTVRDYSGRGPTDDGRTKPDLVGPTLVSTSSGAFGGTSAAAPHIAGVAALVLQDAGPISPATLRQWLADQSLDLGDPGDDQAYGVGLPLLDATFSEDPLEDDTDPPDTDPPDTDPPDTDPPDTDTGLPLDTGLLGRPTDEPLTCSCATGGGSGWALTPLLLLWRSRRKARG